MRTLRSRLWKVAAWVERTGAGVCFHVAATWPWRALWGRVQAAVEAFTAALAGGAEPGGPAAALVGG